MEQAVKRVVPKKEVRGDECPRCRVGLKLTPCQVAGCGDPGWIRKCPKCGYTK